jgi:hypothetical protein
MTQNSTLLSNVLTDMFHALRSPRRRLIISILWENGGESVATRALAREITATEQAIKPSHATGEPYRGTYNALSQTHLPALDAAEVVKYDSKRQTVTGGPRLRLAVLTLSLTTPVIEIFDNPDAPATPD